MSNIFKGNSRFSALLDDKKDLKKEKDKHKHKDTTENKEGKVNSFKCSYKRESYFKPHNEKEKQQDKLERETEIQRQKELEKKEKEQIKLESLSMNNFPALIGVDKREISDKSRVSYIDMLKKEEEIDDSLEDDDLVNLQPGWILIKKDRKTGTTIMKYGEGTVFYKEAKNIENEDIFNKLVDLYEKRTEEYIELNGYDTWEKMFKYPNWREREAYLYEIEESEDTSDDENNENYENDDEYYDDYYDYDDY
jgi:hypothetical protein